MKAETTASSHLGMAYGPVQDEIPPSMRGVPASTPTPTTTSGPASTPEIAPSSVPTASSMSPAALMAYCQSRLQSLDTQMNDIFTSQQNNANATTAVNNLASALNDLSQTSDDPPKIIASPQDIVNINNLYAAAEAACGPSATCASLQKDQDAFAGLGSPPFSSAGVTQLTTNLKNYAADLNSNSEMSMITLQSLMSQRQTAIQLTTNLVQSLGDQASSIAKNIGQ